MIGSDLSAPPSPAASPPPSKRKSALSDVDETPKKEARPPKPKKSPKKKIKIEADRHGERQKHAQDRPEEDQKLKEGKCVGRGTAWTPEERKAVITALCAKGAATLDWSELSDQCGSRTPQQIRNYYNMVLKGHIEKVRSWLIARALGNMLPLPRPISMFSRAKGKELASFEEDPGMTFTLLPVNTSTSSQAHSRHFSKKRMKSGPTDDVQQEEEDAMDSSAPEDNCFEKLINQSTKLKSKKQARALASPKKRAVSSLEDEEMDEAQSLLPPTPFSSQGTPNKTTSARLSTGQTSPKKRPAPKKEIDEEMNEASSPNKKRPQTGQAASAWTSTYALMQAEQRKDMVMSMCDLGYPAMDWAALGQRCGGRTGVQARDYWRKVMKPKLANVS
ncbi:hypothetical protein IE81DRAFT_357119 [Ceraceosorus guamensis]|uniref:Myb-like domain-containing protein n=1 Tax=Ceraceosorus guamensis TaxID=1522189 RepID=A0A316W7R6_9BASI|nr:hypothetical protein IE81DRAFT_357119 [Ceraceosorus guamensis]PWN45937.1 hypothetical protein IE81DRAFT_357119 [Ceraceosorus guamensis]